MKIYLAVDLGAESGRVVAVGVDAGRVLVNELHRFAHAPMQLPSGLHWDITGLWREILVGLGKANVWARKESHEVLSVGVDCWGIDWALLDRSGELLAVPHAYRDPRNVDFCQRAQDIVSVEEIYQTTGIQMMPINTLYSLYAFSQTSPDILASAATMLFIPDLFHYWLSGEIAVEHSVASTSQMLDIRTGKWAEGILGKLGIPATMLRPTVPPGTRLGTLRSEVASSTGLSRKIAVIAPGSHDTASAIAAVPAVQGSDWCYLSSGTWSLLGAELNSPCVNAASQQHMFTNEAGIKGTTRFLKNIAGLWLVQQCRAAWKRNGQEFSYAELTDLAAKAKSGVTLVDPNSPVFHAPENMLDEIVRFARLSGQPIPETPGQFVRCCLDSLALAYRNVLELMQSILERKFDLIHIVGGGSQNGLLNQLAANVTGRTIVPGPVEATAIGNGLVQAMACGELTGLNEIRQLVRESGLVQAAVSPDESAGKETLAMIARYDSVRQ